jgi:hypothetical protein
VDLKSASDSTAVLSAAQSDLVLLEGARATVDRINELSATRKDLQSQNLRDKHWATGSVLLGVGVGVSILGAMNTVSSSVLPHSLSH